jgi:hypothetical protein
MGATERSEVAAMIQGKGGQVQGLLATMREQTSSLR